MSLHLPRVVGLHGLAQTGKDTLGSLLVEQHGYQRVSFAAPLVKSVLALNPILGADSKGRLYRLDEVYADLGYEETKKVLNGEFRGLLDRMGTEVGRTLFGESFWIDQALNPVIDALDEGLANARFVITDVRFDNEVKAVADLREWGSYLLKIQRPGVKPVSDHPAHQEQPNSKFDSVILNEGSKEDLLEQALLHFSVRA